MAREFFKNYPDTTTPLSAERLNGLLDGDEAMGNLVVDSIRSKNMIPVEEQFSVNTSRSIYVNIPVGTYTISGKITGDANYNSLIIFNKNGTELISVSLNHSGNLSQSTFTLTNEIDEIILYSNSTWATSTGQTSTFNELQLEKGNTATNYAPYQELNNDIIEYQTTIISGTGILYCRRSGHIVELFYNGDRNDIPAGNFNVLSALPKPFIPDILRRASTDNSVSQDVEIFINTDGSITAYNYSSGLVGQENFQFKTTYII